MSQYQTISALYVGDGTNRVNISNGGTIKLEGTATVYDDVVAQLTGASLLSTAGSVDYDFDEAAVVFQPSGNIATANDRILVSFQITHSAKADSPFKLHIHWEQTNSSLRTFVYSYRVQNQRAAKTTSWSSPVTVNTTDSNVLAIPYTSGTINQIIMLGDIPLTSAGVSAIVQVRLTRTDATSGNILATYIDGHVEKDDLGSSQEYAK